MRLIVNGRAREAQAATLAALLDELGYAGATVATALNEVFVPAAQRSARALRDGDAVEVVAPMQGG
jgi:sulfur carrier protein